MANTQGLGPCAERLEGSSPSLPTARLAQWKSDPFTPGRSGVRSLERAQTNLFVLRGDRKPERYFASAGEQNREARSRPRRRKPTRVVTDPSSAHKFMVYS